MNTFLKPSLVAKEEDLIKKKAKEVVDFLNLKNFPCFMLLKTRLGRIRQDRHLQQEYH